MKNRNGFTLVELLGAIAILAVLSIVVFTKGFGLLDKTKAGINKIEEDNLLEAARVYLVDVDNGMCPDFILDCTAEKENCIKGTDVNVGNLEAYGYFTDDGDHCDDSNYIKIKIVEYDDGHTDYIAEKYESDGALCTK